MLFGMKKIKLVALIAGVSLVSLGFAAAQTATPQMPPLSKACVASLNNIKSCSMKNCKTLVDGYKACRTKCKNSACIQSCDQKYGKTGAACVEKNCMSQIKSARAVCNVPAKPAAKK